MKRSKKLFSQPVIPKWCDEQDEHGTITLTYQFNTNRSGFVTFSIGKQNDQHLCTLKVNSKKSLQAFKEQIEEKIVHDRNFLNHTRTHQKLNSLQMSDLEVSTSDPKVIEYMIYIVDKLAQMTIEQYAAAKEAAGIIDAPQQSSCAIL